MTVFLLDWTESTLLIELRVENSKQSSTTISNFNTCWICDEPGINHVFIFPVKESSTADGTTDGFDIAKAIFDVIKKVGDGVFSIIKLVKILTLKEETKKPDNAKTDLADPTKKYPNCLSSKHHFIGDDWCDDENNNGDIYLWQLCAAFISWVQQWVELVVYYQI